MDDMFGGGLFGDAEDYEDAVPEEEAGAGFPAAEGLAEPRQALQCLGHERTERLLLDLAQGARMPHALVFAGPRGIGKATMAFRFARWMLHGDAGGFLPPEDLSVGKDEQVFRLVASGGHPDLLTVQRPIDDKTGVRKNAVDVEEARRIAPFLRMTASLGGWRVVIVDDADTMNRNAQNAILKVLEEPPDHALLILVAHRPGALIPTIRSRCRIVPFAAPGRDVFGTLLRRADAGLAPADLDALYAVTGGSAGRALEICEQGGAGFILKIVAFFQAGPRLPWTGIHQMAEAMGRPGQEEAARVFQDVMLWLCGAMLKARACGGALPGPLDNAAGRELLARYPLSGWIEISGGMQEHFDTVAAAHLDRRHAVLGAFALFGGAQALTGTG